MVEVLKTEIADLVLIKPKVIGDARGHFIETFNQRDLENLGIQYRFVQDNQSLSKYGTLRGLHFQRGPFAQTKLIRALTGKILDVVVDLRPESKTFKKQYSVELSDENHLQLLVPRGFAHGFIVLSETAMVAYKCDNFYSPENESGIFSADKDLNIDWKVPESQRLLSPKDLKLPSLKTVLATRDWEFK